MIYWVSRPLTPEVLHFSFFICNVGVAGSSPVRSTKHLEIRAEFVWSIGILDGCPTRSIVFPSSVANSNPGKSLNSGCTFWRSLWRQIKLLRSKHLKIGKNAGKLSSAWLRLKTSSPKGTPACRSRRLVPESKKAFTTGEPRIAGLISGKAGMLACCGNILGWFRSIPSSGLRSSRR